MDNVLLLKTLCYTHLKEGNYLQVQGLQEVAKRQGAGMGASGAEAAANVLACGCGLALQGANLTLNTVS